MTSRVTEDEITQALADCRVDVLAPLVRRLAESLEEAVKNDLETAREEAATGEAELERALHTVRDWLSDVLYLHKPPRDPRKLLRTVEQALGIAS